MENSVTPPLPSGPQTLYGRLKRQYFRWLSESGANSRLLRHVARQDRVVVLNLHRVSPHANPFFQPLHPYLLDQLLTYLKRHFRVATFRSLLEVDARPTIVLSFDDGYQDFVEYAMPLLDKHDLKVNFNVCPSFLEGQSNWELRLIDFLNVASLMLVNEIRLPGFVGRLVGDGAECRTQYSVSLMAYLKQVGQEARADLWRHLEATICRAGSIKATRMMTVSEALEAARIHEIGAHSFGHEMMGLESDAYFRKDVDRCCQFFQERLNRVLEIYAFPSGSYRPEQIEILRGKGVRTVLTSEERYASRLDTVFPRFLLYGDSVAEVQMRALGYRPAPLLARVAALGRVLPAMVAGALGRGVGASDEYPENMGLAGPTRRPEPDFPREQAARSATER